MEWRECYKLHQDHLPLFKKYSTLAGEGVQDLVWLLGAEREGRGKMVLHLLNGQPGEKGMEQSFTSCTGG